MLSFSNFPEITDGFNVCFYRNVEPNVHLTDGKIESAVHNSLISLLCAITYVAICRYRQPFTLSFTNYKYCGCSGRKKKYLEEVKMVWEAALRCHGRRSVVWGTKSVLMDFEAQYTSCIICRRRSSVPVPFAILYGNPVSNRDNKLIRRTGGEILLPLSPISITCISGVRSSRVTPVYGLEQCPTNTYPQGAGLCYLPKRSCVGRPVSSTILFGSVFLQVTCWHWLLRCCCLAGAPLGTQSANIETLTDRRESLRREHAASMHSQPAKLCAWYCKGHLQALLPPRDSSHLGKVRGIPSCPHRFPGLSQVHQMDSCCFTWI